MKAQNSIEFFHCGEFKMTDGIFRRKFKVLPDVRVRISKLNDGGIPCCLMIYFEKMEFVAILGIVSRFTAKSIKIGNDAER